MHHVLTERFRSGALGAGLAIFSRFPIITATIHPYSLNGHPVDVAAGDWFVGKAAASIVVQHPALGEVEVFNTHVCPCLRYKLWCGKMAYMWSFLFSSLRKVVKLGQNTRGLID